jgi:hypothetical protein
MNEGIGEDNLCVKVYDPTGPKLIAVYESLRKASNRLGVTYKVAKNATVNKNRIHSPLLNMDVAVRVNKKGPEDILLISKTTSKGKLD